jgi:carboxylesterase
VPVLPGAEPFSADAPAGSILAHVGITVIHGFTGSPRSMRPWAEALAAAGATVRLPRLPGHGTTWQEMGATRWPDWLGEAERVVTELLATPGITKVFVMGLSMGGTLTLRLAELHGDAIAGIVTVNASLMTEDKRLRLLPILKRVRPSIPGVGSDIAKPGGEEGAYSRVPTAALASLVELWGVVRPDLGLITCPVLAFRSAVDHVVEASSGRLLLAGLAANPDVEEVVLADSFHVATLDHDAPVIISRSLDLVRRLS